MADYAISNVPRRVVYAASGVGPYAFTFEILDETDIAVYKGDTLLTLTTDYTVTINANGTGSVTLVLTAGSSNITIVGAKNVQRTTDFTTGGDLFANSLNDELDNQTIFVQQVAETAERGLKAPVTDPTDINMTLPSKASRAGKTLAFDSNGNPVVGEDIGNWRGNWLTGTSYSVRDLVKDSSNSNVYRCNTAHTSTGTTPISSNVDSAKWDLVVDAAAADASADAAAASAADAAASESAASASAILANDWATKTSGTVAGGEYSAKYHAQAAATSASNASGSATAAQSAQSAAESARDATLAAYDSFDDRYLGTKTSDPTLDNDGNALVAGALYFNSVSGIMKLYTGSAWVAAYVQGNASDIGFTPTGNIASSNVQAAIAEVDSEKIATTAIGSTVQAYDANTAKLNVVQSYTKAQRGTAVALTSSTNSIASDFSLGNNFTHTFTENTTLANPSNLVAGQSGVIVLTQHASSPKTLAYGSYWKFAGGVVPTVTATNSAVDVLAYYVESSTRITARLITDVK